MRSVVLFSTLFITFKSFSIQLDSVKFKEIVDQTLNNKLIYGIQIETKYDDKSFQYSVGNFSNNEPFFIASTTKLFVTATILKLCDEGVLNLNDSISKYLSKNTTEGLHIYKGIDYSNSITIKQLLSHTSGLPDYFDDKIPGEKTNFFEDLCNGQDKVWTTDELINLSKRMKPKFAPGTKGKAHYSDTNFQLLGKIIENSSGKSLIALYKEYIISSLNLKNTFVYDYNLHQYPKTLYYKDKALLIPKAMSSFAADGGIVSNSTELIIYMEAFFQGKLFDKKILSSLYEWNRVMFPLQSGVGLMMAKFPGTPQMIGHSGISGAFAFYVPELDVYFSGTVNQIDHPEISYKMLAKLLTCF